MSDYQARRQDHKTAACSLEQIKRIRDGNPLLSEVISLGEFQELADKEERLEADDQLAILSAAQTVLRQIYVNLPLKRSMHAVDPIQRLRLMERKIAPPRKMPDRQFHAAVQSIFTCLRDLHTLYTLPEPYK